MDWLKIGSVLLLIAMMVMLFPRLKQASENAPKGSKEDWLGVIKPLALVVVFVIVLIMLAR
jgi:hypothetical protein